MVTKPDNPTVNEALEDAKRSARETSAIHNTLNNLKNKVSDAIVNSPKIAAELSRDAAVTSLSKSMAFSRNLTDMSTKRIMSQLLINERGPDGLDRFISEALSPLRRSFREAPANNNKKTVSKVTPLIPNLSDIAKETTQSHVVENLSDIKHLMALSLDTMKHKPVNDNHIGEPEKLEDIAKDKTLKAIEGIINDKVLDEVSKENTQTNVLSTLGDISKDLQSNIELIRDGNDNSDHFATSLLKDVAKESTQQVVADGIHSLHNHTLMSFVNGFLNLGRKLARMDEKLKNTVDHLNKADETLTLSYNKENDIYELLKEQNEIHRTRELRETGGSASPEPPPMPMEEPSKLRELGGSMFRMFTMLSGINSLVKVMSPLTNILGAIGGTFKSLSGSFGLLGNVFKVIIEIANIVSPFKKILIGGFLIAAAFGMVDSIDGMWSVFEAITKVFTEAFDFSKITSILKSFDMSAGIFNETIRIIKELFNANFGFDIDKIKKIFGDVNVSSGRLGEFMAALSDIYTKQLLPAFQYIVDDVMVPFAAEMQRLWVDQFAPRIKAIMDYFTAEGPGFISALKVLADFAADVLIFFFAKVLPPILDGMGLLFKGVVAVVKEAYNILRYLLPAIGGFIVNQIDNIKQFFGTVFEGIGDIINAQGIGETIWESVKFAFWTLPRAIGKYIWKLVDNLGGFIMDFLGINEALGNETGTTVSQAIGKLFGKAVDGAIALINKLNPIPTITEKVNSFIDAIISVIPTMDDIIAILRQGADAVNLGWLVDKIVGDRNAPAAEAIPESSSIESANARKAEADRLRELSMRAGMGNMYVIDNSRSSVTQASAPPQQSVGGVARTTARTTPLDRRLYGGVGF